MDGQKVVKVFCHEEEAKAGFRKVNEELRQSGLMGQHLRQYAHARQREHRLAQLRRRRHLSARYSP